jgi:hypothetical protein
VGYASGRNAPAARTVAERPSSVIRCCGQIAAPGRKASSEIGPQVDFRASGVAEEIRPVITACNRRPLRYAESAKVPASRKAALTTCSGDAPEIGPQVRPRSGPPTRSRSRSSQGPGVQVQTSVSRCDGGTGLSAATRYASRAGSQHGLKPTSEVAFGRSSLGRTATAPQVGRVRCFPLSDARSWPDGDYRVKVRYRNLVNVPASRKLALTTCSGATSEIGAQVASTSHPDRAAAAALQLPDDRRKLSAHDAALVWPSTAGGTADCRMAHVETRRVGNDGCAAFRRLSPPLSRPPDGVSGAPCPRSLAKRLRCRR